MILKTLMIPSDAAGMTLEKLIRILMPDLSESFFHRLFSSRDIKLDGSPAPRQAVLRNGQELKIYLPEKISSMFQPVRIVYEDDDVLVVNKPSGISVEDDPNTGLSLTGLCRIYLDSSGNASVSPAACHRLDVKTCGLCLFAKNERTLQIVQDSFRNRNVVKYYICLVRGMMKPPSAVCSAFLIKDAHHAKVRISDQNIPGSRPIVTGYETIENGPVSRLKIHLMTGRTHQIRAHMAALGHPVLGDDLYGDRTFNRLYNARSLKLCSVSLAVSTGGALPRLDNRTFTVAPPF